MPRTACLLAAAATLLAASPAAAQDGCADADLPVDERTIDRAGAAILCLVNERRGAEGRQPLRASRHLERSARSHSRDMVEHGYLAHEAQGRPTLYARVRAAGYFDRAASAMFSENIGVAPVGASTARGLVDAWAASPAHRANVLHPMFADLGVGWAFAEPGDAFYPEHRAVVITTDYGQRVTVDTAAGRRIARRCRRTRRRAARRGTRDRTAPKRVRFCAPRRRLAR